MNEDLFLLIFKLAHQSFILDQIGIFLASYLPYFLILAALILIFSEPDWRRRIFLISEAALAIVLSRGLVVNIIRFFYPKPRPFEVFDIEPLISGVGHSLPSGHASILFALATIVFYINRRWGGWFLILVSLNGLARVFGGVHFPLDILAGAAIGILSGYFVSELLKPYLLRLSVSKGSDGGVP